MAKKKTTTTTEESNVTGKSVVIVESPAKIKTVGRILGRDFTVLATMGHIRDLPKSKLGIDIENDFKVSYLIMPTRKKEVDKLKKAVKGASAVYLAPDPDREGEAIAWHVVRALKLPESKVFRVTFNEITAPAIKAAFNNPGQINMHRVEAQQARRILDRVVGYMISPLLWKKVARGLSAGRVQSVAVLIIVTREQEIRAFKPEEFWKMLALLNTLGEKVEGFEAEFAKLDGKLFKVKDGETATSLKAEFEGEQWIVGKVEKKVSYTRPQFPFNTALLQQAAANRLGFTAKRTMRTAQSLYEGIRLGTKGSIGLITYMRTDSYRVSSQSISQVRAFIAEKWGADYVPDKPRFAPKSKRAQDAHEAIRPTDVYRTPESIKEFLSSEQFRLYKLIWHQFVTSQMKPARYNVVNADIKAGRGMFRATGKQLIFDGFLRGSYSTDKNNNNNKLLPPLFEGQNLKLKKLDTTQHFTQPPPRYTEATLVKALEKEGIGRPSTYATIISTIQDRGYVKIEEKKFHTTELGEIVTDKLVKHFPNILDVTFTRRMESRLDEIEDDKRKWLDVVKDFYGPFSKAIEAAQDEMETVKGKPIETGETCPECGLPLIERISKFGRFYACSGYPKCKYVKRDERSGGSAGEEIGEACPDCGKPLLKKMGRRGPFLGCSAYPTCKFTRSLTKKKPQGENAGKKVEGEKCPKCEGEMVLRYSRRGPFLGCAKFPKCKGTKKISPELAKKLGLEAKKEKPKKDKQEEETA